MSIEQQRPWGEEVVAANISFHIVIGLQLLENTVQHPKDITMALQSTAARRRRQVTTKRVELRARRGDSIEAAANASSLLLSLTSTSSLMSARASLLYSSYQAVPMLPVVIDLELPGLSQIRRVRDS